MRPIAASTTASTGRTPWSRLVTLTASADVHSACNAAAVAVIGERPARRAGDARALVALVRYIRSGAPATDRAWCLLNERYLFDLAHDSAAAGTLRRLDAGFLTSASIGDRLVGALAMRRESIPSEALPLLRLALPSQPAQIRIAALQSLAAPMRADLHRYGASVAPYASAIAMAERSPDPAVVAAGFGADGMLRGPSAGSTFERALETDERPAVRAAALDALDSRDVIGDELGIRMIDRGLRDRATIVREAAMDALEGVFLPSAAEERRIATIAATAPTAAERAFARASLADVRRDRHDPARLRYVRLFEHGASV